MRNLKWECPSYDISSLGGTGLLDFILSNLLLCTEVDRSLSLAVLLGPAGIFRNGIRFTIYHGLKTYEAKDALALQQVKSQNCFFSKLQKVGTVMQLCTRKVYSASAYVRLGVQICHCLQF